MYRYAILGAGRAGLSLCCELLARGVRDPIVILDRRRSLDTESGWCLWGDPVPAMPTQQWSVWKVQSGERIVPSAPGEMAYTLVQGADGTRKLLEEIERFPNVELRLRTRLLDYEESDEGVQIATDRGNLSALQAFDTLGRSSPRLPAISPRDVAFWRIGFTLPVCTDQDRFDPEVATLMDFLAEPVSSLGRGAMCFFSLLPLSPREARVEHVCLLPAFVGKDAAPTEEEHQEAILQYLQTRYGGTAEGEYRALGPGRQKVAPVTRREFERCGNAAGTGRVQRLRIGAGALGLIPGAGYAPVQRQIKTIGEAVAQGRLDLPSASPSRREAVLDAILLTAVQKRPEALPALFLRLFQRNSPAALGRWLLGEEGAREASAVLRSLMGGAALEAAPLLWRRWKCNTYA